MKGLAWWAIGVGLGLKACCLVGYSLDVDVLSRWYRTVAACDSIGYAVFFGGAVLLAATVIADAITKTSTARTGS